MLPFILAVITIPLSWAGTALVIRLAHRRGYLAAVNARSSHRRPTPQGAGWAVMGVTLPVWCMLALAGHEDGVLLVCAGALALGLVAWRADLGHGGIVERLAIQAVVAVIAVLTAPTDNAIIYQGLPWALDRCLAVVGLVYFINLFNFIDGIDGLAGVGAVGIGIGAAAVAALGALPLGPWYGLAVAGAALGFLIWNWYPARIFLGDVGSAPLGYLLGFLLMRLAAEGQWQAALILPAYQVGDATITLLRRAFRGERIWQAHREHYYQRAARALGRHSSISGSVAVVVGGLVVLAAISVVVDGFLVDVLLVGVAAITVAACLARFEALSVRLPAPAAE
jgi:UDP-N-acetylmuramyl pentapeptide phosphotransferase/UDP-N-acetylglucosamine-1-phosphate transferase